MQMSICVLPGHFLSTATLPDDQRLPCTSHELWSVHIFTENALLQVRRSGKRRDATPERIFLKIARWISVPSVCAHAANGT